MSFTEDQTWDLEQVLPGGVSGQAFQQALAEAEAEADRLIPRADALGPPDRDLQWVEVMPALDALEQRISELYSFAGCHAAANALARGPAVAEQRLSALAARYERAWANPTDRVARCSAEVFETLCARPAIIPLRGHLEHVRERRPVLLPAAEQSLFDELADDALHGWGQLYRRTSGTLRVMVDGEAISTAQARNRLESPDPALRRRVFEATEQSWREVEETCATALTRIVGVRQTVHDRLGVDELAIPLVAQRLQPQTLDALLAACHDSRALMWRYFRARTRALGTASFDWQDMLAPVGQADLHLSWDAAQAMVADTVGAFSPDMGDFVALAFRQRWVEAEDRPGKRAGAFCASFPLSAESRVFMTFGGGPRSVSTLAHELGHAYHNHVMWDLLPGQRHLTSCLAETASTFAESLVRGALLDNADAPETRLALIDRELADASTFLVNIPVRFDFERALFQLRAKGPLQPEALSQTMERIQREWYGPDLGVAHPLFWADKLHFYLTRSPFYNFPYTFGYLFSAMAHQRARDQGPAWADTWRELLRATGGGPTEDVAARFLDVDLTQVDAWTAVIARLKPLVDEYEALVAARD